IIQEMAGWEHKLPESTVAYYFPSINDIINRRYNVIDLDWSGYEREAPDFANVDIGRARQQNLAATLSYLIVDARQDGNRWSDRREENAYDFLAEAFTRNVALGFLPVEGDQRCIYVEMSLEDDIDPKPFIEKMENIGYNYAELSKPTRDTITQLVKRLSQFVNGEAKEPYLPEAI
ncbi:MAG: hypothetical protein HGA85_04010, partial [Nanoarchaeota archaeon]|nr:hypothetical protein [Nanoarchaeota archaeon]